MFENFSLHHELESPQSVIERISKDAEFKGTNLWVLVIAIFIASLGLNINSTAVVIGAMLISPLMGPIMAMGLGLAINDLQLVKKAVSNFTFAILASLFTSFVYFLITPIHDAYSELLARTFPTIFDVLIALCGGLAGILANSSRKKGNVIPGVAIATALMPPLCTAGYGLATLNPGFFLGAFYLFTINTVFIALATFMTVKFLKFPSKHLQDAKADARSRRIITIIAVLTLIPSIYFGYLMIEQNRFSSNADVFAEAFSSIDGNYLLDKKTDPITRSIILVYGGKEISPERINDMKNKLDQYGLKGASLTVKEGFTFMKNEAESPAVLRLKKLLELKEKEINRLTASVDSVRRFELKSGQVFRELKTIYPEVISINISYSVTASDSGSVNQPVAVIETKRKISVLKKKTVEDFLKERLNNNNIILVNITKTAG
jgi:uncharacterized hydrophobic protein (TIGR00271 family)